MSDKEESTAPALKDAAGLIPELYYDLISRVTPGLAVLLTWLYSCEKCKIVYELEHIKDQVGATAMALLVLIGGYVIGILLSTLSYPAELALDWYVSQLDAESKRLRLRDFRQLRDLKRDETVCRNPASGSTAIKMAAETALCQNLIAGLVVLLLFNYQEVMILVGNFFRLVVLILLLFWAALNRADVSNRRLETIHAAVPTEKLRSA
jgi:hypothetical protein